MKYLCLVLLLFNLNSSIAQVNNTKDTTHFNSNSKVSVEGYLDAYYSYDFNKPASGERPYSVSMNRHNEITINLAYIGIKYTAARLRGHIVPGFGTYINANYANESFSLKNIIEANAGVKLWSDKNIWLDVGVFTSPYTNESAISKDHLTYTRSLSSEYSPYYLSGVKLSLPIADKLTGYFYLINGWQQINDVNEKKSIGTQLEYRYSDNLTINWNTYLGNEQSQQNANFGTRYFTDLYFVYTKGRWSATGCYYIGLQARNNQSNATWWQANIIGQYGLTEKLSIAGRFEYFNDPEEVQVSTITGVPGFNIYGSSLGANFRIAENILFRAEGRTFFSNKQIYERAGESVKTSTMIISNLTLWF